MKVVRLLTSIAIALQTVGGLSQTSKTDLPVSLSQPITIEDDDWRFDGTENILLVSENRNQENSRDIALHFFKFPAREKSNLPPVVFLGAGPGEPYSADVFYKGRRAEAWRTELNFVNQKRDVILINQRGNSNAPGMQMLNFKYKWNNGGTLEQAFDIDKMNKNRRAAYLKKVKEFQELGIDLRGYDILHFIDDIDEVRKFLGYDKVAFIGNSFASQWALGYIQRYPQHVDRALLSGIEPLDHNYDDPKGIWEVFKKINSYAMRDATLASQLPKGGLIEAFKVIIKRLEKEPQAVTIKDEEGNNMTIVVGADDFRFNKTYPYSEGYRSEIESWPKYITELYNRDYRVLASASIGRIYNSSSLMINPLFNNSLGISAEREKEICQRESRQWLGEINGHYTSTRDICPAPKVLDDFRQHKKHDIPIVLIQGDMDLSTPYENAIFLTDYLENAHLITVKRGSHNAKRALIFADSVLTSKIYHFMNVDFEKDAFIGFSKTLPLTFDLAQFTFWDIKGEALFEKINMD